MRDVILLAVGAIAGVIATELYSVLKSRYSASRSRRNLSSSATRDDPRTHAINLIKIFEGMGAHTNLYVTSSTADRRVLPILPDISSNFVGPLRADSDWPLVVSRDPRHELVVDDRVIADARRRGVELWDGTILYAPQWDEEQAGLRVQGCNYFSYVSFGNNVLRESDSVAGKKPYLEATHQFSQAMNSTRGPTAIAAATTCVFELPEGRATVVHRRSSSVVTARGMYAMTPVHGIEPNFSGTEDSRYGAVVYNVLKEILEELFGIAEIKHSNNQPHAPHPDWIFTTEEGELLVAEPESGRLELFCNGACIDLTDGSLILAVTAHFRDAAYVQRLKYRARGSDEAGWVNGRQFEFFPLAGQELESTMTVDRMIASSIFSADRARARFASISADA
jgi:hypothetical protein